MKNRESNSKKPNCNNFNVLSLRDTLIQRSSKMQELFPWNKPEIWLFLPENNNYKVSSWGRVINLKSYGNKPRMLTCTLRQNKYPYLTISLHGRRKGLYMYKIVQRLFRLN
ncbi:MAG: hypothetical protein IPK08_06275 [Bacteroidetes bacterium]|nr:hypothetical protein [Bacteroidota bacterium]